MAVLITKWFGVFLCEENRILAKRLMPKDSDEIAEKLAVILTVLKNSCALLSSSR